VRGILGARTRVALLIAIGAFVTPRYVQAQANPNTAQRTFAVPEARVQQVLRGLLAATSGHLPVLDGFVDPSESLDHLERGFYQCTVQEAPAAGGGTTVRVTAKITAWFKDPAGSHSGYRVLASNGRIESDFLDNVADALGVKSSAAAPAPPRENAGSAHTPATNSTAQTSAPAASKTSSSGASSATPKDSATPDNPPKAATEDEAPKINVASMTDEDIRARREEIEKRIQELNTEIQNFEQIQHGQSRPEDISVVKKSGTPIYSNPEAKADVLMSAEAGDEFPILDVQGGWVHVQISGPSRGWMHRTDLDMPGWAEGGEGKTAANSDAAPLFRVTREDVSPFAGTWEPLKDKVVKIVWVAPADSAPAQTSPKAKREYAKSLFLKAYRETANDLQAPAGVVVIFDSADGGQAAATTSSVKLLNNGKISVDQFWGQCSLDPPEAFQDEQ
jgi:Bacterial SH3 domain